MDSFQINKFVGAFLASILLILVINGIGNLLVPGPDTEGHEATSAPQETSQAAATPAEDNASPPAAKPAAAVTPLPALLAVASVDGGRKVAKRCAACHSLDNGGPDKVGPNLWGIVGAKVAHRQSFRYSDTLAQMDGNWGYSQLDQFLANSKAYAPGTRMSQKIKSPTDRANLIVYLRSLSDNPLPLPAVEAGGGPAVPPNG